MEQMKIQVQISWVGQSTNLKCDELLIDLEVVDLPDVDSQFHLIFKIWGDEAHSFHIIKWFNLEKTGQKIHDDLPGEAQGFPHYSRWAVVAEGY